MSGEEQFVEGDGLLAVWAGAAGPDPGAEDVAVLAALLADVAGVAGWALVDPAAAASFSGLDDEVVGVALTIAVGPLATGWVAVALSSPGRRQRAAAARAAELGRHAVITRRELAHAAWPCSVAARWAASKASGERICRAECRLRGL